MSADPADPADLIDRLRSLVGAVALADHQLPSEPSLAVYLGASRPALREALVRLESEGLVSRRRGAATTINRDGHRIPARFDQQVEFSDVIEAAGHRAGLDLIDAVVTPIDPKSAELLGVEPGSPCLRTVKRWTADGRAVLVAIDELLVPPTVAPDDIDPRRSLFENVRRVHGRAVEWEIARPGAEVVTGQLADWVDHDDHDVGAVLTLDLVGVDRTGDRLYRAIEYHVPGAVEFGFVRTIG